MITPHSYDPLTPVKHLHTCLVETIAKAVQRTFPISSFPVEPSLARLYQRQSRPAVCPMKIVKATLHISSVKGRSIRMTVWNIEASVRTLERPSRRPALENYKSTLSAHFSVQTVGLSKLGLPSIPAYHTSVNGLICRLSPGIRQKLGTTLPLFLPHQTFAPMV